MVLIDSTSLICYICADLIPGFSRIDGGYPENPDRHGFFLHVFIKTSFQSEFLGYFGLFGVRRLFGVRMLLLLLR